jgi:hypothetical protein
MQACREGVWPVSGLTNITHTAFPDRSPVARIAWVDALWEHRSLTVAGTAQAGSFHPSVVKTCFCFPFNYATKTKAVQAPTRKIVGYGIDPAWGAADTIKST